MFFGNKRVTTYEIDEVVSIPKEQKFYIFNTDLILCIDLYGWDLDKRFTSMIQDCDQKPQNGLNLASWI